jgi:hypothetical protein
VVSAFSAVHLVNSILKSNPIKLTHQIEHAHDIMFDSPISTHTFTLGDATSMKANVCGPARGYLKAGAMLHKKGIQGLFTAAEIMPQFVS